MTTTNTLTPMLIDDGRPLRRARSVHTPNTAHIPRVGTEYDVVLGAETRYRVSGTLRYIITEEDRYAMLHSGQRLKEVLYERACRELREGTFELEPEHPVDDETEALMESYHVRMEPAAPPQFFAHLRDVGAAAPHHVVGPYATISVGATRVIGFPGDFGDPEVIAVRTDHGCWEGPGARMYERVSVETHDKVGR